MNLFLRNTDAIEKLPRDRVRLHVCWGNSESPHDSDVALADILPKFADMQVQVTPDGSITDLRPAKEPITIRNLVTHTSGLGYTIIQRGPIKEAME